jgi:hypothetical protein
MNPQERKQRMRRVSVRDERGIALVIAIVALVVIGAIGAGTFFVSNLEQRTAQSTVTSTQALQAAEAGAQMTIANWNTAANTLVIGDSLVLPTDSLQAGSAYARYDTKVYRLNNVEYLVRSVGTMAGTSQAVGAVLKLFTVQPTITSAVTSFGSVSVGGSSTIDGNNNTPTGWSCPSFPNQTGIRSHGTVDVGGHGSVNGSPAIQQRDSTLDTTAVSQPFNQLKQYATITVGSAGSTYNPPGNSPWPDSTLSGGTYICKPSSASADNWGEPHRAGTSPYIRQCANYFPVVYVRGSARLPSNSRGQGILLIQEDVDISGGFEWTGLILVHGQVRSTGTGAKITGAVMSMNDANLGDLTTFNGNPTVLFSQCAINEVLRRTGVARPILARTWTQLP